MLRIRIIAGGKSVVQCLGILQYRTASPTLMALAKTLMSEQVALSEQTGSSRVERFWSVCKFPNLIHFAISKTAGKSSAWWSLKMSGSRCPFAITRIFSISGIDDRHEAVECPH